MKRIIFLLSLVLIVFQSCEEVPPFIDFSEPVVSKDTNYVVSIIPPAQHKAVLIEDITGVRCVNCPQAAQKAKEIVSKKTEDSVVIMALYTNHIATLTTPYDGFPLLNSDISTQIVDYNGIPAGLPSGYIDRAIFAPQTVRYNNYSQWATLVDNRLRLSTPVNISIQHSISGRKISLDVKLIYTEAIGVTHRFAMYLTESDIISKQATTTGTKDDYVHNHVLRYAFGSAVGNPLNANLVKGRTFDKKFEYEVPADYKINNCHILCVILDGTTDEVVNVRQISLK